MTFNFDYFDCFKVANRQVTKALRWMIYCMDVHRQNKKYKGSTLNGTECSDPPGGSF